MKAENKARMLLVVCYCVLVIGCDESLPTNKVKAKNNPWSPKASQVNSKGMPVRASKSFREWFPKWKEREVSEKMDVSLDDWIKHRWSWEGMEYSQKRGQLFRENDYRNFLLRGKKKYGSEDALYDHRLVRQKLVGKYRYEYEIPPKEMFISKNHCDYCNRIYREVINLPGY